MPTRCSTGGSGALVPGFGPRKLESLYYLAEVISSFDLVAVQEINRGLRPLQDIMKVLGGGWDYIVTDATEGRRSRKF